MKKLLLIILIGLFIGPSVYSQTRRVKDLEVISEIKWHAPLSGTSAMYILVWDDSDSTFRILHPYDTDFLGWADTLAVDGEGIATAYDLTQISGTGELGWSDTTAVGGVGLATAYDLTSKQNISDTSSWDASRYYAETYPVGDTTGEMKTWDNTLKKWVVNPNIRMLGTYILYFRKGSAQIRLNAPNQGSSMIYFDEDNDWGVGLNNGYGGVIPYMYFANDNSQMNVQIYDDKFIFALDTVTSYADNISILGYPSKRWKSLWLGPGTTSYESIESSGAIQIGNYSQTARDAGTIYYNSGHFYGYDGATALQLDGGGGGLAWSDTTAVGGVGLATAYDLTLKQNVSDTSSLDATRYWVNQQGFLDAETDPVYAADSNQLLRLWEYWNNIQSASRLWGGTITDDGDGTITVAAGGGLKKADEATPQEIPTAINQGQGDELVYVSWSTSPVSLTDEAYNYVYLDGSDNTIKATTNFYSISFTQDFTVGRVYRSGTNLTIRLCGTNAWNFNRRVQLFGEEIFPVVHKGMNVAETGERYLTVTSGILWAELVNRFPINALNTSGSDRFTTWYRNGVGGWTYVLTQSQINNTSYDDGDGTLGTLSANRYGVHWVYMVHDNTLHVVYGQGDYTLTQAEDVGPPSSLPGVLSSYSTFIAKIIVQKSATNLYAIYDPDVTDFAATPVTDHGGLSGLTDDDHTLYQLDSDTSSTDATRYWVGQQGYLTSEVDGSTSNELQDLTWDAVNGHVEISNGSDADIGMFSTTGTNYGLVPGSNNATGSFLRGDGTWQTPGGGGNVSNTGTPANNQLAIWTNSTTIEGDADITFDGSKLTTTQLYITTPTAGAGDYDKFLVLDATGTEVKTRTGTEVASDIGALTSEVDGSVSNEGSLTVVAGGADDSQIQSNTSGSTNVTISAGTNIDVTEAGSTITIAVESDVVDATNGAITRVPVFTDANTINGTDYLSLSGTVLTVGGGADLAGIIVDADATTPYIEFENTTGDIFIEYDGDVSGIGIAATSGSPNVYLSGTGGNTSYESIITSGAIKIGTHTMTAPANGTVEYDGTNFRGYHNGWVNLDVQGGSPTTYDLSLGTGLTFSSGAGTGRILTGAATIGIASGYYLPTTTDQTNWGTAYTHASTTDQDVSASNEIEVSDEVYNSTNFDGGTAQGVSQDDFYDFNHLFDTDDDGLPNKVDLSSAGFVKTDASGVLSVDGNTYLTSEVDGSVSNEGSLTVQAGGADDSQIQSNTSGSTNVTISAGTNIDITESAPTITIATEADVVDYTGTQAANNVSYFTENGNTISGEAAFTYDASTNTLTADIQKGSQWYDITTTTYSGRTETWTAGTGGIAQYDLVYVSGNGTVLKADRDAVGTAKVLGIAPAAITQGATGVILTAGVIYNSAWAWTAGSYLYNSSTAGEVTSTVPATSGYGQRVGIAIDADRIEINIGSLVGF